VRPFRALTSTGVCTELVSRPWSLPSRVTYRKPIQGKKLEVTLDMTEGALVVVPEDDRENPTRVDIPPQAEPMHLAVMGYFGAVVRTAGGGKYTLQLLTWRSHAPKMT
jgi:hypothetical protein